MEDNLKKVSLGIQSEFSYGLIGNLGHRLNSLQGKKTVFFPKSIRGVVADINVHEAVLVPLQDGEDLKSLTGIESVLGIMMSNELTRGDVVISLGGGSLMDSVGFASSIFKRGIRLVNVPTTLLGMVDAGLGGKTAVNFKGAKNMIGTFYFPESVWAFTPFLETLSKGQFFDGMAEIMKYSFTIDSHLHQYIMERRASILKRELSALDYIILRSMEDKIGVVVQDPLERKGVRNVLNFGHTIGHALESASGFRISHGSAVSVGMVLEQQMAEDAGIVKRGMRDIIEETLHEFGMPTSISELSANLDPRSMSEALRQDKKILSGHILLPVSEGIGKHTIIKVSESTMEDFFGKLF